MDKSLHNSGYRLFREELAAIRADAGLTQKELAARLGEGQDFVSKTERGVRRLDVVELRQYCEALGVSFTDFTARLDRLLPKSNARHLRK